MYHNLVIGYGEIGKAICEVFSGIYWMDWLDVNEENLSEQANYKAIHVCIPYSDNFIGIVNDYIKRFNPHLTIVHSTVPIGTTRMLKGAKVHAPVRGRHENLAVGIRTYKMHIGWVSQREYELAWNHFSPVVKTRFVNDYETTEAAKLLSLIQYAFNIEFARYAKEVCDKWNLGYEQVVKDYTSSHNIGVQKIDGRNYIKPILEPPEGKIGGHCVLNATRILNKQVGDNFLRTILAKSGE